MNVFLDLTRAFNAERLRAVICSGQAVVLHRLAIMSKDGDWILREDVEALDHVLSVLERRGASYRFGAPLAIDWMRGGWSSHFEFRDGDLRVRTDFFTRPPRLNEADLDRLWQEQADRDPPFTGVVDLARIKMTRREKDYPVIGELARLMPNPADQLRFSRSARDLIRLGRESRDLVARMTEERPLLTLLLAKEISAEKVAEALDAERRRCIAEDERRMASFESAARAWREQWPTVREEVAGLPLRRSHAIVMRRAKGCLPEQPAAAP